MLSACSTTQPVPIDLPCVDKTPPIALPSPVETRDVEFGIITAEDVEKGLTLKPGTITLTPDEFEDLVYNIGDAARWVQEAVDQLRYYRGEDADEPTSE